MPSWDSSKVQGRQFTRICRCRRFLYPIQGYGGIPVRPIQQCGPEHDKQRYRRHTNAEERQGFRHRAQFHNVSKAQIYGMEISTNACTPQQKRQAALYLGYVYTEPRDADYKKRNALENTYTDPLQMKEKSNDGKYLKYRPKHSFKATLDFQWKRINIGANVNWKSKILAWTILCWTNAAKVNLTCWTTCAASSSARPTGKPWHPIGKA